MKLKPLQYFDTKSFTYPDTGEGKLEEMWRTLRTEVAEGDVVHSEVLRAGEDVGVRVAAGYQLAQDDPCTTNC